MSRPKIPNELKFTVIYESARTCCVCRDPYKGFQIHHIDEDNSNNIESNLIVLCLDCHDKAHTKKQLSQNLTKDDLYSFKKKWKTEVKDRVLNSMLASKNAGSSALWTYINHTRLPSLLHTTGLNHDKEALEFLSSKGIVDKFGVIQPTIPVKPRSKMSVYDHVPYETTHYVHRMYNDAIESIILNVNPIDIDAIWKRRELKNLLKSGSYIYSLRGFHFKDYEDFPEEGYSMRLCHATKKKIRVEFRVNTRDMFGDSSVYDSFYNHRVVAALLLFKSFSEENGVLILHCTPVAMGMGFWKSDRNSPLHVEIDATNQPLDNT